MTKKELGYNIWMIDVLSDVDKMAVLFDSAVELNKQCGNGIEYDTVEDLLKATSGTPIFEYVLTKCLEYQKLKGIYESFLSYIRLTEGGHEDD